ncbi:helix-turn-helix DNA binding protein [Mycobacterium phage Nebkiss]|nr:helix-turn-helix DNA binding protein [Mycobacterium phage Nebkiss]
MSCYKKARRVYSERTLPASHVLTPEQVVRMRHLYASGFTQAELAREFNVTPPTVSLIVRRLAWRNV